MSAGASTTDETGGPRTGRSRDAAASRHALLEAAQVLFGRHGFEHTTTREIGELAGVDAALIARYFGGKADLYIAAVVEENLADDRPSRVFAGLRPMADEMMTRADDGGPGPILQAIVRSDSSEEIREAALTRLARRLVDPLASGMNDRQVERARLRGEIAAAALVGISLGRSLGWFDELRSVPRSELVDLITETLGGALGEDPSAPSA